MRDLIPEPFKKKAQQFQTEEFVKMLQEATKSLSEIEKAIHPLGLKFDSVNLTLSVPPGVTLVFKRI